MFGQKFNPYSQFPNKSNQVYQDQYEEEDSEPLVEEFDTSYEPTDKQVKQYAIQVLGMSLPEDQGLLYIARQGLKAPIPPNWVPYQSRNGQVYYKHRITQQKTFDHPTDTEYRKKYEQQKQKMARKNLKSMNMKSNAPGMAQNLNLYGSGAANLLGSKLSNSGMMSASNNLTSNSVQGAFAKLDPRIEEQYQIQLKKLEERLKKEWRDFQTDQIERHEAKLKKAKEQYESDVSNLFNKKSQKKIDDKLNAQKEKIRQKIQQSLKDNLQSELRQIQRDQQHKTSEFRSVYQEDNTIKLAKHQQEKTLEFENRQARYLENIEKANSLKERKKKEREDMLIRLREELEDGTNPEIQAATQEALLSELAAIKETYLSKIKALETDLERQYNETKRVLGFDQTAYLSELATKKSRIKSVCQQKLQSFKKKEINALNQYFETELQSNLSKEKEKLERQFNQRLEAQKRKQQLRVTKEKEQIDEQTKRKSEISIQTLYDELKFKSKSYQKQMNKKISTLNEKFINDIYTKSKESNKDIIAKLQVKQKEMSLQNKQQMIDSLKRQLYLESITYQLLKLQQELYKCSDSYTVDQKLMQLSKNYELDYRPQNFLRYQKSYKQLKLKYKKDKQFLASVMNSLQGPNKHSGVGGMAVLKQYNQDVRIMRENEETLRKFEIMLKKAEYNDKLALLQLQKDQFEYKDIEIRKELVKVNPNAGLHELSEENIAPAKQKRGGHRDLESALQDHSKFLSSMRHQLNRKLYQLRSGWNHS